MGTAIGFVLGAVFISVVGVDPAVMWTLLPLVVFGSAYVPEIASFIAGQAMFTMMVLIFFNLIVPTGWSVGPDPRRGRGRRRAGRCGGVGAVVAARRDRVGGGGGRSAPQPSSRRTCEAAVLRFTRGASEADDDQLATLSHDAIAAARVAG